MRYRVVRANPDGDIDPTFHGLAAETITGAASAAARVRPRGEYRGDVIDAESGRFVSWVAPEYRA